MKIWSFILIADSYLLRKGLVYLLNRMQGVRVIREFGADESFLPYLGAHPVDFIVMDQFVFDSSHELFIARPELLEKTILIQGQDKEFLESQLPLENLPASIGLMEDEDAINHKLRSLLDQDGQSNSESNEAGLSPRETTIVRLVAMGLTNREIAEKLFLSAHTVMTHRKNITAKLGIKSVSGLTVYAIVNNIITIEEVSTLPAK